MKQFKSIIFISLVGLSLSACSTQWRESDPGIDSRTLFEIIDEAVPEASAASGQPAVQDFLSIAKYDSESTIFFAEGPGTMGSAASMLAFIQDFSILGKPGKTQDDVKSVVVMLAEGVIGEDETLRYALFFDIIFHDGDRLTTAFSDYADRVVDGKEFTVALNGPSGQILIRSLDVSGGELKNVIQLEIYDAAQSEMVPVGKISTMVAFSP